MADCPHLARTSAYFDGALPAAEEADATAHLAGCDECQRLLGDAVGFDAALAGVRRSGAGGRRWPLLVGLLAIAAAGLMFVVFRDRAPSRPHHIAIALASERAVEARFTGSRFAPHRPLGVLRGDIAREPIALATMAELEKRGELHDLVAALAASGDLARAKEVAAKLPQTATGEADRAAVALAAGDTERALAHALRAIDRDATLAAGHWNLALAARALRLPRVARAELEHVARSGEPGWADEAKRLIEALGTELAIDDRIADVDRRGQLMVGGGALLTADDVAIARSQVWIDFLDAVRVAGDRARLDALRPLASALDAATGTAHATAMIDRADPALAARFAATYRTLVDHTASPDATQQLLADLRAAGPRAGYILVGALILANQAHVRRDELARITAPWQDPWFDLLVERERIVATWPDSDLRAEAPLLAALSRCGNDSSMRCGNLALDLATLANATGRDELALASAEDAADRYHRGGRLANRARARSFVAELHRRRGRIALARAEFEELVLSNGGDCDVRRYARIGQAMMARLEGEWDAARAKLPPAELEPGCTTMHDVVGLATAVDLARQTGAATDLAVARTWIARAAATDYAAVAEARLARGAPAAAATIEQWIREVGATRPPDLGADIDPLAWAHTTLVADAGARSDWQKAFDVVEQETPSARGMPCAVIASADDDQLTVAVRTDSAVAGVHRRITPVQLATAAVVPADLVAKLRACSAIAVVARPPLHGRADLLPPELPWWFAGDTPIRPPAIQPGRALEVVDARPSDPLLPRLAARPSSARFEVTMRGPDATPSRVLAALAGVAYAELHVHGVVDTKDRDAAYLALSPDPDGTYALRADAVRTAKLASGPIVVLAACRAASVAPYLRTRWSLPDAFLAGGASAVIATDVPISDASARRVFDDLHRRIDAGEAIHTALAAVRAGATGDTAWAKRLVMFR